jgi:hypothetical protein
MKHSYSQIILAVAKFDYKLKSIESNELAGVVFGFTHPQKSHLANKLNHCGKNGGLLQLLQSLDYENTKMVESYIKSLIN